MNVYDAGWKERYEHDARELGVVRAFLEGMDNARRGQTQSMTMYRMQAALDNAQAALEHACYNMSHQEIGAPPRPKKGATS